MAASADGSSTRPPPSLRLRLLGLLGYAGIALLLTYPLLLEPASAVVSHWLIDAEHSLWIQWWFDTAIDSPSLAVFQTDRLRYPDPVDLQLADVNLAVNALLYWVSRAIGAIAAYNVVLWGSFVASAWLLARLAGRVCGDDGAAWFAGLVYAASSYWLSTALNSWMYLIHIWVLPLALLALLAAGTRKRLRDFLGSGLALAIAFHVSPYYFLFLGVLLALLAPFFFRELAALFGEKGVALRAAAGTFVLIAMVAPRAWLMIEAGQGDYFVHTSPQNTVLAAQPLEFVWPSVARPDRQSYGMFMVVFLGYTSSAVVAFGLLRSGHRRRYLRWLVPAALLFLLALGPAWGAVPLPGAALANLPGFDFITNHWRWSLPGVLCLSIVAAIALAELRRAAHSKRDWLLAAAVVALLAEVLWLFPFPFEKTLWRPTADAVSIALRDAESVEVVLDLRPHPKLHQMTHGKRIVGGWLPRLQLASVERTRELLAGLASEPSERIGYLGAKGIDAVVVDDTTAFRIAPDGRNPGAYRRIPLRLEVGPDG